MTAHLQDSDIRVDTNLGDLIAFFYQQFMDTYKDPELASVATAAIINDLLSDDSALLDDALSAA